MSETIKLELTVTISGDVSPELLDHVRWHLAGDNRWWDTMGNYETLNDAFRGWLQDRMMPDFNELEQFYDEGWGLSTKFQIIDEG